MNFAGSTMSQKPSSTRSSTPVASTSVKKHGRRLIPVEAVEEWLHCPDSALDPEEEKSLQQLYDRWDV